MKKTKKEKEKYTKKSLAINISVMLLLAVIGFLFAFLCGTQFTSGFFGKHRILFTALLLLFVLSGTICAFLFYFLHKQVAYRLTFSIFLLLDLCLVLFYCLLTTGFLEVVHNVESFKEYLSSAGAWMDVLFIVLQFLQVVILPIPSFVTLAAGTALFGPVKCFIYSYISIVLGSLTAFFIGRLLGYKAVAWMVGKETLDGWLKKVKGKDYLILTAMFVLPFFPDDLLCFVAGLSSMTSKYFTIMILLVRAFSAATTCFSIGFIPFNTWWGILSWIAIGIVVVVAFFLFYKNQEKIHLWIKNLKQKKKRKTKQ